MERHDLSKSTFVKGMQCHKALYMSKNHKELASETSAAQEVIFSQGTKVGELAQQLFPGGVDCSPDTYYDFEPSIIKTAEAIKNGATIIYEAAFQFNGVLAALDILVKDEEGWKAYEVKSSTEIKDTHEVDATIQYYAITNSGIDLNDISIVYINNKYVKNGPIDVHKLFSFGSVKEKVLNLLPGIPDDVELLKNVLKLKSVPNIDIGPHCSDPHPCAFHEHCWKHIPEYSVFDIATLRDPKKFALYKLGAVNFKDIPKDYKLTVNQRMQINCELDGVSLIDKNNIKVFLNSIKYPLYFMDFETFRNAIPVFDNSRPYQNLVFQYSMHLLPSADEELSHTEFLAETGNDPRKDFIDQLINDCGTKGHIMVYNKTFEQGKLAELAILFPEHSVAIGKIIARLIDLMVPFQKRWYYLPEMQGSYSIKDVLPAMVPELSYDDLNIKEGGSASDIFASMVAGEFEGDVEQTRKDLLAYCKLDTLAMVEILKKLKTV